MFRLYSIEPNVGIKTMMTQAKRNEGSLHELYDEIIERLHNIRVLVDETIGDDPQAEVALLKLAMDRRIRLHGGDSRETLNAAAVSAAALDILMCSPGRRDDK